MESVTRLLARVDALGCRYESLKRYEQQLDLATSQLTSPQPLVDCTYSISHAPVGGAECDCSLRLTTASSQMDTRYWMYAVSLGQLCVTAPLAPTQSIRLRFELLPPEDAYLRCRLVLLDATRKRPVCCIEVSRQCVDLLHRASPMWQAAASSDNANTPSLGLDRPLFSIQTSVAADALERILGPPGSGPPGERRLYATASDCVTLRTRLVAADNCVAVIEARGSHLASVRRVYACVRARAHTDLTQSRTVPPAHVSVPLRMFQRVRILRGQLMDAGEAEQIIELWHLVQDVLAPLALL